MNTQAVKWQQLIIATDHDSSELISMALQALGAVAITLQDGANQALYAIEPTSTPVWSKVEIIGLFPAQTDLTALVKSLKAHCTSASWFSHQIKPLPEQNWTRVWMQDFHPMCFGERLWICPHEIEIEEQKMIPHNAIIVRLDPGLAFGSGTHETTALMLKWIATQSLAGQTVLDFGCGSGILAIAAYLCGAHRVIGVDHDPQALMATQENACRNQIPPSQLPCYLPQDLPTFKADIILANILAEPLITLASEFTKRLKPGGQLIMSGLLSSQVSEVIRHYPAPFIFDKPVIQGDWARVAARLSS